jgi:gamma-glutamylcyclotransferase (GGCT)/AIG2-like uncharacterized protein YtfP
MMRIFVYGTLKRGYGLNHYLKDCPFLGNATTVKPYELVGNGVPAMLPGVGTVVQGEVYEVNSKPLIEHLDRIESAYDRKQIKARFEDGTVRWVNAYIGNRGWSRSPTNHEWLTGNVFNFSFKRGENA